MANIDLIISKKIFVKLNYLNFPAIIPVPLCKIVSQLHVGSTSGVRLAIALLTVISLFRVLPTKVKPDYSTIEDPFKGTFKTIDSQLLKQSIENLDLDIKDRKMKLKLVGSLKAGPNGKISLLTSGLDALAFVSNPSTLFHFVVFNSTYGVRGSFINL